jgi:type I restriction enzyme, R subunit
VWLSGGFIGILKELNKALAFDSDKVSGVIEDLDLLFARFNEMMAVGRNCSAYSFLGRCPDRDVRGENVLLCGCSCLTGISSGL